MYGVCSMDGMVSYVCMYVCCSLLCCLLTHWLALQRVFLVEPLSASHLRVYIVVCVMRVVVVVVNTIRAQQ